MQIENKVKIARIFIVLVLVSIAGNISMYFSTKSNLVSPLIPGDAFLLIAEPYLYQALMATIAATISLLFYFYSKHITSIFISSLALLIQAFYY